MSDGTTLISAWKEFVAIILGSGVVISAVVIPILKGVFITKEKHTELCGVASAPILKKVDDLSEQVTLNHVAVTTYMEDKNETFEKIERYLLAIMKSPAVDVKPEDIDRKLF